MSAGSAIVSGLTQSMPVFRLKAVLISPTWNATFSNVAGYSCGFGFLWQRFSRRWGLQETLSEYPCAGISTKERELRAGRSPDQQKEAAHPAQSDRPVEVCLPREVKQDQTGSHRLRHLTVESRIQPCLHSECGRQ